MKYNKEILILALVMSVLDIIMMGMIRKYYLSAKLIKYILPVGMLIYMLQPILFYKALFFEGIGVFNIVWNSVSNLLILFTGIYFFSERLTIRKYIGVILSFISIYLLTTTTI